MSDELDDELENAGVPHDDTPKLSEGILKELTKLGYSFRMNKTDDSIEVNGQGLSDAMQATIRADWRDLQQKNISVKAVEDVYIAAAAKNAYHPIQDYLRGLQWDGQDHISRLIQHITSADAPVVYDDGTTLPLHAVYLYKWLIGAVQKVFTGKQNAMLIFDGPQNLGKSEFVRWLARSMMRYYHEGPINTADKDNDVRLITAWIWEVSELDATTRKADVAALKDFVTRQIVSVRKAYARNEIKKPAMASLFGTINNSVGFLADDTGSRRYWPTKITAIDWNYRTNINVDQVWAQAYTLWMNGETNLLTPEEVATRETVNERYEVQSTLDDYLDMFFTITGDKDDSLSAGEIIQHLNEKGVRLSGTERAQAMELARVLKRKLAIAEPLHTKRGNRWPGIITKV